MELITFTYPNPKPIALKKAVVTIGNFDGCHKGHVNILNKVMGEAKKHNLRSVVITFNPKPSSFFKQKGRPAKQEIPDDIFTSSQKNIFFQKLGFDEHWVLNFNEALANLEAKAFFQKILLEQINLAHLIVGHDFAFGKNRQGNAQLLEELCRLNHLKLYITPEFKYEDISVHSSLIRGYIRLAQFQESSKLLGHDFELESIVTRGNALGQVIGFPTANFQSLEQIIPSPGVYAGFARLDDSTTWLKAVASLGYNPTVSRQDHLIFEVHIFDPSFSSKPLYGHKINFAFKKKLRAEIKFAGLEELKIQIQKDIDEANNLLCWQ